MWERAYRPPGQRRAISESLCQAQGQTLPLVELGLVGRIMVTQRCLCRSPWNIYFPDVIK